MADKLKGSNGTSFFGRIVRFFKRKECRPLEEKTVCLEQLSFNLHCEDSNESVNSFSSIDKRDDDLEVSEVAKSNNEKEKEFVILELKEKIHELQLEIVNLREHNLVLINSQFVNAQQNFQMPNQFYRQKRTKSFQNHKIPFRRQYPEQHIFKKQWPHSHSYSSIVCYRCFNVGHKARFCTFVPTENRSVCENCGKFNHCANECRTKQFHCV